MKKTRIFITSILTAAMLSACSTAENSVDENTHNKADSTASEASDKQNAGSSQQNNSKPDTTEQQQLTLSYTIGQQTFKKQYELVHSTQQDFSIQLTDQFYLTEEEPGMDAVVYKENEAIMMRVEVLSDNEWTYEDALENSKALLTASSKDNHFSSFDLPKNINSKSLIQYDSYIVENESDKIVLLLIKLDEKIIRLTIFDDYITNVTEAFLIQGITIK
jgi:hypothetical protein